MKVDLAFKGYRLAHAVVESCDEAIAIAGDLLAMVQGWERQIEVRFRADSAARRLPRLPIGHPVLTVKQAAGLLDITVQAASGLIESTGGQANAELTTPLPQ